jgi:hypothetical protein
MQNIKRILTEPAITKNGVQRLAAPPALDVEKYQAKTKKKIEDEEILKILELPTAKAVSTKPKTKKKKKKPAAKKKAETEEEESDDSE